MENSVDIGLKVLGGIGFVVAVLNYRNQVRIKRAEWLKSLYEKFFESSTYKEVRVWLDYDHLGEKLGAADPAVRESNEEKFTDFLNFFEFIGVLYSSNHLTFRQVYDVFDYYLKKIKSDDNCQKWINGYGFEKLKKLLKKVK